MNTKPTGGWWLWTCRAGVALAGTVFVLALVYMYALTQEHRVLTANLDRALAQLRELQKSNDSIDVITASRMDYVERVLFGEVVAKLDAQRSARNTARVELWQKTRDKELRDRIMYLEQRLFRVETAINKIR